MNDYYRILEIEPNATQGQIKEQYRFLVQAWHPDKFGSLESKAKAEEKLKQINEAYDVLKDSNKRKQYDRERQYSKREYNPETQKEYERQSNEEARAGAEAERRQREQAEAKWQEKESRAWAEAERHQKEQAEPKKYGQKTKRYVKAPPFLRVVGIVVVAIALYGTGSWITSKFSSIVPTTSITQLPTSVAVTFTATPEPTAEILLPEITDAKGVPMVLVPAGDFTMGSNYEYDHAKPIHTVYLDTFYIDKYEVTNAFYKACVEAGVCQQPHDTSSSTRSSYYGASQYYNYPVIYVDWDMARTYCEWRDAQLPTEAQWEKAARGTDGRTYPWGEGIDCNKANYSSCVGDTTEVGNYKDGVSPYGVYEMAGNVWEWVADWYSESYFQNSPSSNPLGPDSGPHRVLRGGAWYYPESLLRTSDRVTVAPDYVGFSYDGGFRCSYSP